MRLHETVHLIVAGLFGALVLSLCLLVLGGILVALAATVPIVVASALVYAALHGRGPGDRRPPGPR